MSHKVAKRMRQAKARHGDKGPWVNDGDCLVGHPMCHDCAFRKGSKEMLGYQYGVSATGGEDCPEVYVVSSTYSKSLEGKGKAVPFYCHFDSEGEVPKDENGKYQYDVDERGVPSRGSICNGWRAMCERIRRVQEADGAIRKRPAKRIPKLVSET